MTAVPKVTAETEAVLKEDSAEETDTNDGSGETKEVDLMAVAKLTAETETVLKEDFAGKQTRMWSLVKRRRLFDGCSKGINRSRSLRTFC